MRSGRGPLRELLELMVDAALTIEAGGGSFSIPIAVSPAGNFHAFYLTSVVPDAASGFVTTGRGGSGANVEWGEGTLVLDGQRLDYLSLENSSLFDINVHVRVYRVRGLADT